jgi:hypothetical protein
MPVHTVVFETEKFEDVLTIKKRIRDIYGLENHSIHISDTGEETKQMAELMYNRNSLHHLNYGKPYDYNLANNRIDNFKKIMEGHNLNLSRFAVESGSVLEIYGLRLSGDLDYITDYDNDILPEIEECENHLNNIKFYDCGLKDSLYNMNNYFFYNGMKYISLPKLLVVKQARGANNDKKDCKLINKVLKKSHKIEFFSEEKILNYQRENGIYGGGALSAREYLLLKVKKWIKKYFF